MRSNDFFGPAFSLAFVTAGSGALRDELFTLPRACGVVPATLQAGAAYKVKSVDASAFGAVYLLEGIAGECVRVELSTRGVRRAGASIGAHVTVTATGFGRVLVSAGDAFALVPNAMTRALLDQQALPA